MTTRAKPVKSRRRKKPEDPRQKLVEARLGDIQRWAGKGLKPTEIAKRLRIESVTGAYLNGALGQRTVVADAAAVGEGAAAPWARI